MPVLLILIIGTVMIIFWDTVKENVEVIGTLATSLAFLATAWAAYEARNSAKAAMRATSLTAASLLEMKKSSFKEWYGILIEQHNKLLEDVNKALHDDSQYKINLSINIIKKVYYHATKNPIYIKYVNHVILILNYVDKDFYLPSSADSEKISYIEQLRNSISPEISLLIAIFGLNVDNNKTYDAKKLCSLLNKYNFFGNELFFKDAMSKIHYLDSYVSEIFNQEYQRTVEFYVDKIVSGCAASNLNMNHRFQRLTFAVLWSYENPCRQHLLQRFNDLSLFMRNRIELNMENAAEKVAGVNSFLTGFVSWELKISDHKLRVIRDEKQLKRLINLYYKHPFDSQHTSIVLTNGATNRFGHEIEKCLSDYALDNAYLVLRSNQHKEKLIGEIEAEVERMVDEFKAALNSFGFN